MKTEKQYIEEYRNDLPISQATHSGLWGYDRALDCLDLSRCVFKSKRAAQLDRAKTAKLQRDVDIAYEYVS